MPQGFVDMKYYQLSVDVSCWTQEIYSFALVHSKGKLFCILQTPSYANYKKWLCALGSKMFSNLDSSEESDDPTARYREAVKGKQEIDAPLAPKNPVPCPDHQEELPIISLIRLMETCITKFETMPMENLQQLEKASYVFHEAISICLHERNKSFCTICLNLESSIVLVPCGHLCICQDCSKNLLLTCPICRQDISMKVLVHKV